MGTINRLKIDYDPSKNAWNIAMRGLSFDEVEWLDWGTAIIKEDSRKDYGEKRMRAIVDDDQGLSYCVVFTMRDNDEITWIISFRRAHKKEREKHEKDT